MKVATISLVTIYLAAIVAANYLVTDHPGRAPYLAFTFIALDLVSRDRLHLAWKGHVLRNMALLIASGSIISTIVNTSSSRVALASAAAFGLAATVDGIVFHLRRGDRWEDRSMMSNAAGAAVDSFVFPLIAFVGLYFSFWSTTFWTLVFTLFCAKVAGSWVWTRILRRSPTEYVAIEST